MVAIERFSPDLEEQTGLMCGCAACAGTGTDWSAQEADLNTSAPSASHTSSEFAFAPLQQEGADASGGTQTTYGLGAAQTFQGQLGFNGDHDQVRRLLQTPEIIVATWRAGKQANPKLTEREVREALHNFDELWAELFPAEQARIVQFLVERVTVHGGGADVVLRVEGLTSLFDQLQPSRPSEHEAA